MATKAKKTKTQRPHIVELKVGHIVLSVKGDKYEYPFSIPYYDNANMRKLRDACKQGTIEVLELKMRKSVKR